MLRAVVFFIISFFSVAPLFGQLNLQAFAKTGLNVSSLLGESVYPVFEIDPTLAAGHDSYYSFHVGAGLQVKLARVGAQVEVLYSQQGSQSDVSIPFLAVNLDYIEKARFHYLMVPLLFRLNFPLGVYTVVGPQYAQLMREEVRHGLTTSENVPDELLDRARDKFLPPPHDHSGKGDSGRYRRSRRDKAHSRFLADSQIFLVAGLGWDVPFGLFMEGRFSINPFDPREGLDRTFLDLPMVQWVAQLSVGYTFYKIGL